MKKNITSLKVKILTVMLLLPCVYCVVEEGELGKILHMKLSASCLYWSKFLSPFSNALCSNNRKL